MNFSRRAALTSFTYRYDGKLLSYTDPNQATYAFAYDTEGQRTSRTYPDNSQEKYAYFADGSLQTLTKPDGTTISHEYDAKSRLTRQTNSSTNEMVNFSYDAKGQLVSAQNAATSLTRSYDSAGRVLGETSRVSSDIASLSDAKTISYSYNPDGLVAQMARPIGYGDSYQYDARNQLSSITSNAFGAPVVSYQRNPRGQITATTQRNGITNVRNYDDAAQLLSTDYFDGQNLISRAAYTYSQAGQRSSLTRENAQSEQFGYDNSRQLTSVTRGTSTSQNDSYSYDLNGNRSAASDQNIASPHSYSVNNLNQYTAISGKSLSYDANGNQTTSPQDAGASLKYDWNDRLIQVNATSSTKAQPATSGLAWDEIRYVYDPLGRRLAKTVTENGAFKRATRFIYNGWNVVEERTERQGAPGISKFLFWGEDLSGSLQGAGGVGGLLTQMEKTDTSNWSASYYHYDGNGNVATVSGPFRAVIAKFSYDGFGRTVSQTGAKSGIDINAIPYRFSTKPMELELATSNTTLVPPPVSSGLYYYGYRFYSPNLGRWISRDPIREKGGRNLYNFVGNDGVDQLDLFGLEFKKELHDISRRNATMDLSWGASTTRFNPVEVGENKIAIECDDSDKTYKVFISESKRYDVTVVTNIIADELGILYTSYGLTAIRSHEDRRIEAQEKAYNAHLKKFESDIIKRCKKTGLTKLQANAYAIRLEKWLSTVQSKSLIEANRWDNIQRNKISLENKRVLFDYSTGRKLVEDIINPYKVPEADSLILDECPE